MLKLESVTVDVRLNGVEPGRTVTVVQAKRIGDDALSLTFRRQDGSLGDTMLFRSHEAKLAIAEEGRPWSLDADPTEFKLAAEAHRISLAYLFDPMMAIHTSNVDPLPHQITAVYESMLPRQPLRFLLADDPGAGKTIMAGLLMRELMVRGDLERCLVVAPGGLVEQWQDEMADKFDLHFRILSRQMVEESLTGNPFAEAPFLICRLDQLARAEDLQAKLYDQEWDLIVIDEAHKMSAHWYGTEKKETKRYQLGTRLGGQTRNLLLMTATPHNGKEEDFQLFLALLDADRFYGRYRDGVHQGDTSDMMRRQIKEELMKFDGTPLFPERKAYTINYELSDEENALYQAVTSYVQQEMGRADNLEGKRKGTVGFALTILQRRLASSPEAIYQSLKRRRKRLMERKRELEVALKGQRLINEGVLDPEGGLIDPTDDDLDEYTAEELERLEDELIDQATAAQTLPELDEEIKSLEVLEKQALHVRNLGSDRKWEELSKLLQDEPEMFRPDGSRRKMIVFTEHKDTLNYLASQITGVLGNPDAVGLISGSVKRENRRKIQEQFRQDPEMIILLATDAAGEGVNLQNANLMVNYDLPWNPNRIEQRFGRIHRIGQTEVCHLWNMVAVDTREGVVFQRLFEKLEVQNEALKGRVFNVLGDAFSNRSLRDMLIEAIRYGEQPEVKARLTQQIDMFLDTEHLKKLIERSALGGTVMSPEQLFRVKEEMEAAEARKLQPFFIRAFFTEAFERLGGELRERETGRYTIPHVPSAIRANDRLAGSREPVLTKYDRICFDRTLIRVDNRPMADLVHPGHPLMASVLSLTREDLRSALAQGSVLLDPSDEGLEPRLLFLIDHQVREGSASGRVASRRLHMVEIAREGGAQNAGHAPYLDYKPLPPEARPLIEHILSEDWLQRNLEEVALNHAVTKLVPDHFDEVRRRREDLVDRTLVAVQQRLVKEINYWSNKALELEAAVQAGRQPRMQPINARRRAQELATRLEVRKKELESQRHLVPGTPVVLGGALIVPRGLLDQFLGKPPSVSQDPEARARIERIAMDSVMDAERALGNTPRDVSAEKLGWDVTSRTPDLGVRFIEVKGRVQGAKEVTVTRNEILQCLNNPEAYYLAIVLVEADDSCEGPFYLHRPFTKEPELAMTSQDLMIDALLENASTPSA